MEYALKNSDDLHYFGITNKSSPSRKVLLCTWYKIKYLYDWYTQKQYNLIALKFENNNRWGKILLF